MKHAPIKKLVAIAATAALAIGAIPVANLMTTTAQDAGVIYETGFEDGTTGIFTGRNAETLSVTTEENYVHSGNYALKISDRTAAWNGPAIPLDDICTPGEKYTISLSVKTAWYASITLSMQENQADGATATYSNFQSANCDGNNWVTFKDVTFTMPEYGGVSIYVECSYDASVDIYVDDVTITALASASIQDDLVSLKDLYSPYFKVGTAVTTSELAPQATKDLINKHFNSITLGNELKPDAILDQSASLEMAANGDDTNPQVDISSARSILNFARDNDISVRGHVLVWYSQTPEWFFHKGYDTSNDWCTADEMLVRMENYIKNVFETVVAEYPTVDFYAWDVCNECLLDDGSARVGGSNTSNQESCWTLIFGDNSFIKYAFEYARKYAPEGCKLYYNDFNEYTPAKTQAIVNLVTELAEDGLIDGIGMQSHLDLSYPSISLYESALQQFAETGLDIQITELDVTTTSSAQAGNNSDEYFEKQAQYYSDLFDLYVKYSDYISAVIFWGTTDDESWRSDRYPLIFNGDYTAKPAYYAIIDGLELPDDSATTTEPVVTTTEEVTTTTEEITTTTEVITTTTTEPEPEPEPNTPIEANLYGDVNLDENLNMADVIILARYIATDITLDDQALANADCNDDGIINNVDLQILVQFQLGVIKSIPA